jgi:hypothetical protein
MQAKVDQLCNALPECSAGPSPGPLTIQPRHGAAEIMAGGRPAVESPTARAHPGSTGNAQEEGS